MGNIFTVTFPSEKALREFIKINRECFQIQEQKELPSGQITVKLIKETGKPRKNQPTGCLPSNEEQQILF